MKSIQILFVLLLSASVFVGCKKKADNNNNNSNDSTKKEITTESKFDKMAKEACACAKDVASIKEKIDVLTKEGKTEELSNLMKEIAAKEGEMNECMAKLEEKHGIAEADVAKVDEAIKKNCPNVAKLFELAGDEE